MRCMMRGLCGISFWGISRRLAFPRRREKDTPPGHLGGLGEFAVGGVPPLYSPLARLPRAFAGVGTLSPEGERENAASS